MTLEQQAEIFAINAHKSTNHYYDGYRPYAYHLRMVLDFAHKHVHYVHSMEEQIVFAGCWIHDVMEDARKSYNDVKNVLGFEVAELGYALWTEKGRTRKDRLSERYYQGIRDVQNATFIKLCDRLANVRYGLINGGSMLEKYKAEHWAFKKGLQQDGEYINMWNELDTMIAI